MHIGTENCTCLNPEDTHALICQTSELNLRYKDLRLEAKRLPASARIFTVQMLAQ